MRSRRPATVVLALAALLTTSCSSQQPPAAAPVASASPSAASAAPTSPPAAPAATPASPGATITISGFAYDVPAPVRPGEQVTVVNQDREAHTVTVDRGAVRLPVLPGATAVFTAPSGLGAHQVVCDLHGGMDAVLVVA